MDLTLFTIIPLNSNHFHQIGKFGIIFDTRPCEIDDLTVSSRHAHLFVTKEFFFVRREHEREIGGGRRGEEDFPPSSLPLHAHVRTCKKG